MFEYYNLTINGNILNFKGINIEIQDKIICCSHEFTTLEAAMLYINKRLKKSKECKAYTK